MYEWYVFVHERYFFCLQIIILLTSFKQGTAQRKLGSSFLYMLYTTSANNKCPMTDDHGALVTCHLLLLKEAIEHITVFFLGTGDKRTGNTQVGFVALQGRYREELALSGDHHHKSNLVGFDKYKVQF